MSSHRSQPGTRLVLVRHGESHAQEEGIVVGHDTCPGLSSKGIRQAELLRDRLVATGDLADARVVYTSLLARAVDTADIVVPGIGGGHLRPEAECGWCELHGGSAEGLPWAEVAGDPDDPFRRRMPGMETWAELFVRVGTRMKDAVDSHEGGCVVSVSHGGAIGASFVVFGDTTIPEGIARSREIENASVTEWRLGPGGWRLERFNDCRHLAPADRTAAMAATG